MVYQQQSYQNFAVQPAPGLNEHAQSTSTSYPPSNGIQPAQGNQSTGQQNVENLQPLPHNPQSIVGSQYCAPFPTTFFIKYKKLSWSRGHVTILDGQGGLVFTVDGKALSIRGSRVLKDAAGIPICVSKAKLVSVKNKWMIYRGAQIDDSLEVASVNRELFTMRHGFHVKLPGSDVDEYSLHAKGFIVGNREVDILHRGQIIGHVARVLSGNATSLDKRSYKVELSPGYDHAFILCVVIIMHESLRRRRRRR